MSKRPSTASSSISQNAHPAGDEERDKLLSMLNSHGQSFLSSFKLPVGKPAASKPSKKKKRKLQESQEAESTVPDDKLEGPKATPIPSASISKTPDVVVFDARAGTSSQPLVRGKGKGFMSSKIHHVQSESQPKPSQEDSDAESDQDISNARNDKLLHELVHSQLLSNPDTFGAKQGSAKRSRTVAGRLLELADDVKIGRGAEALKAKENSHHAKRVRLGLLGKAKEREVKALEEAKMLGNYHPSIKKNFDSLSSGGAKRRRERGLALGIGKFRNGALTLSKNDIKSVEGAPLDSPWSGRNNPDPPTMRKIGLRRALSTKPVPRQADPEFVQEDVDEHGHVITTTRRQPARKNSLLARVFRKKSRQSEDLRTVHSGEAMVVHPPPMHPADEYDGPHSFGGAGTHLMTEVPMHEHSIREHSVRGGHSVHDHHSARDQHSVRGHSVRGDHSVHGGTVYGDNVSRGYPDYASTAGGTRVYEHDYGHEGYHDPHHDHVTVVGGSPSQVTSPHSYHHIPVSAPATVVHRDRDHDLHSRSGSSSRSSRSGRTGRTGVSRARTHAPSGEVEVNLQPGEKQEFVIGPNTQLIVPDDVELEISDGKGGWLPYHESLLRRPPREEVYVISGGSNFIVEDELGNVLHRSQPSTYSAAPVSTAGSVAGRSTRSRRDDGRIYVDA
ncbi:unnamed protein product [Rhizoctonia solani]|uniref:Uncharacterized protein n=1 Tax=Rhizoctonia solani TaxID=456999 RepID=A0A8H3DZC5_9AGAM|nr:unnamed protein product [Rhizoctonia solani]